MGGSQMRKWEFYNRNGTVRGPSLARRAGAGVRPILLLAAVGGLLLVAAGPLYAEVSVPAADAAAATKSVAPPAKETSFLLGGRRADSSVPPTPGELALWYKFCLIGVIGPAGGLAWLVKTLLQMEWPDRAERSGGRTFWIAAFLLGAAATPFYNVYWPQFVFTWPVSVFVAFQVTVATTVWAALHPERNTPRRIARALSVVFLAVCLAYAVYCRRAGLMYEGLFLIGIVPAWPIAVYTARMLLAEGERLRKLLWSVVSFSAFYWTAAGALLLRGWMGV